MKRTQGTWMMWVVSAVVAVAWLAPAALAEAPKADENPAAPAAAATPATPAAPASTLPPVPIAPPFSPLPPPKSEEWLGLGSSIDDWMEKAKTPFPWLRWGADMRLRDEFLHSAGLNNQTPRAKGGDEFNYQRYRPRWWATIMPVQDFELNLRITWEGRHYSESYHQPTTIYPTWVQGGVLVDTANVKLKNVGGMPLTMTLGRQDIILGDGWLVLDGTPNDGSRTSYFDAARFTYEIAKIQTSVDAIFIDQKADGGAIIPQLLKDNRGARFADTIEQDERGFILWLSNRSLKNTEINGYYMYKDSESGLHNAKPLANGDTGYVHAFGARIAGMLDDHWRYRAEGAFEFGRLAGPEGSTAGGPMPFRERRLSAFGFNSEIAYLFKDTFSNEARLQYEYLSGDDAKTPGTNEGFVLLWGRWPRFSEALGYQFPTTGEGRAYDITNYHRLAPGWSFKPCDRILISTDLHFLFAPENPLGFQQGKGFSENGSYRGELLTCLQQVTLNKHVKAHLLEEFFFPGNYYAAPRDNMEAFLRGEIVFTW
jgi:hypothetical protein